MKVVVFGATSSGPSGASNVLSAAVTSAPFFSADLVGSLSVFFDSFDIETGTLINKELNENLLEIIRKV